jgi:hypothetical protein
MPFISANIVLQSESIQYRVDARKLKSSLNATLSETCDKPLSPSFGTEVECDTSSMLGSTFACRAVNNGRMWQTKSAEIVADPLSVTYQAIAGVSRMAT